MASSAESGDAMRQTIDVNALRDPAIQLHGLTGVDRAYTLYYDETNNYRRVSVTAERFNVPTINCFVLGGLGHTGRPHALDLDGLRAILRIQASAPELKLAHLGKGTFLELLGRPKVGLYLRWLRESDLFVHHFALDPLYWSTVDVIDSILANPGLSGLRTQDRPLKDDLFTVLRVEPAQLAELYHRFSYPNVGLPRRRAFLGELRDLVEARQALLTAFGYNMLKGVLDAGLNLTSLPFLEDEPPNTVLATFSHFFIHRLCLFKHSTHILDAEPTIQKQLASFSFQDRGIELSHFRFADSKTEAGIQLSDPIVGLLGKLYSYIGRSDVRSLRSDRASLSPAQTRAIMDLGVLISRSTNEVPAFMQRSLAQSDMELAEWFLESSTLNS